MRVWPCPWTRFFHTLTPPPSPHPNPSRKKKNSYHPNFLKGSRPGNCRDTHTHIHTVSFIMILTDNKISDNSFQFLFLTIIILCSIMRAKSFSFKRWNKDQTFKGIIDETQESQGCQIQGEHDFICWRHKNLICQSVMRNTCHSLRRRRHGA